MKQTTQTTIEVPSSSEADKNEDIASGEASSSSETAENESIASGE